MDDPIGHLDRDLLSRDRMVRPTTRFPMRESRDTFETFRSIYGRSVRRGELDDFDNERLYGNFIFEYLMTNEIFILSAFISVFRPKQCLPSLGSIR